MTKKLIDTEENCTSGTDVADASTTTAAVAPPARSPVLPASAATTLVAAAKTTPPVIPTASTSPIAFTAPPPTVTFSAPPVPVVTYQLTLENESSLSGIRYFNVFPPILKNISAKSQIRTALVSQPTSQAAPATTLMWKGGEGALAVFALTEGITLESAERVPVALGDTVAVDWAGKGFTLTATSGGPANAITLTFANAVPLDTQIGLLAGPAPILVAAALGQTLTLEPDLSPTVTVVFGTAFQLPEPVISDWSKEQVVTLKQVASDTGPMASAQIRVGLDNRIIDIG